MLALLMAMLLAVLVLLCIAGPDDGH